MWVDTSFIFKAVFFTEKTKKFYPFAPTPFVYRDLFMYCLCTNEVALIEVSFIKSNSGFFYSSKVDVSDKNSLGIMMMGMNSISVVCKTNCCVTFSLCCWTY